jgi:phage/plasmid-like protein (TIGR03299 family)
MTRRPPWQAIGTHLQGDERSSWPLACKRAGLDWDVELTKAVTADKGEPVPGFAVRRVGPGNVMGVVGKRFNILQNREAFEWFQPFLDAGEAQLDTAGSSKDGQYVWLLAKLNREPIVVAPNDTVQKYLLLSHGHTGNMSVRVGFTPLRVVCSNMLARTHRSDASKLIRIKHSASMHTNLANIRDVMNLANAEFEADAEQYRLLCRRDINAADLKKYVKRILAIDESAELATRTENQIEEIIRLCESGVGQNLVGSAGTLWGAYNGVAEWLEYQRGRNDESRLNSLWFGDSANVNRAAMQIALNMAV